MSHVRAILRLIVLAISLIFTFIAWILGALPLIATPDARRAWRNNCSRMGARLSAWSVGMRISVTGSPPEPPFCLVANHLSYLDAVVLMAHIRGVMISKSEVASWPFIGLLSRGIGTVFIDRTTARDVVRVNTIIRDLLQSGDGIAFFPEGTTSDGSAVGPFRSSLLNYPAESSYPVHYAAIRYETDTGVASDRVCWWGDMGFGAHLYHLARLPRFRAEVQFGVPPVMGTDRKQLTAELQSRIEDLFTPVH